MRKAKGPRVTKLQDPVTPKAAILLIMDAYENGGWVSFWVNGKVYEIDTKNPIKFIPNPPNCKGVDETHIRLKLQD